MKIEVSNLLQLYLKGWNIVNTACANHFEEDIIPNDSSHLSKHLRILHYFTVPYSCRIFAKCLLTLIYTK